MAFRIGENPGEIILGVALVQLVTAELIWHVVETAVQQVEPRALELNCVCLARGAVQLQF